MFKKAFDKLRGVSSKKEEAGKSETPKSKPHTPKLLTAEGWKRLMMKKHRKS